MTKERAKELLPVIQAFAEGKEIQFRCRGELIWNEATIMNVEDDTEYRVKPRIVPFASLAEFCKAWNNEPLFDTELNKLYGVTEINVNGVRLYDEFCSWAKLADVFEFEDGTPCGKEVTE